MPGQRVARCLSTCGERVTGEIASAASPSVRRLARHLNCERDCSPDAQPDLTTSPLTLLDPKPVPLVPLLDGLLGIVIEGEVVRADRGLDPARLVAQHQVRANWRDGKGRIDGGGEGVHEIGPIGVVKTKGRGGLEEKMAWHRA